MRALSELLDPSALFEVSREQWHLRQCPVCGGALSVTHTHTYVVQRQDWIKIGATSNVRRRINELRRPAWTKHLLSPDGMDWHRPLATLAVLEGDTEHQLHERFADSHARGEWFLPDAEMLAWARTLGGAS